MDTSPGSPLAMQQFYRQSADETLGVWVKVWGKTQLTFYCTSNGTTSSGVITFEEAAPEDMSAGQPVSPPFGADTGKYSAITTQNASTFSGGQQIAIHITNANFYFVRARISTVIGGGGTVSVGLVAC